MDFLKQLSEISTTIPFPIYSDLATIKCILIVILIFLLQIFENLCETDQIIEIQVY